MQDKIPVSVIITTKNEAKRLPRCLEPLAVFSEIWVVDSNSEDSTQEIAKKYDAKVVNFTWSGVYPKKRQWCLDNLCLAHDFVFFVDADEILTPAVIDEIRTLDFAAPGYFVKGRYVFNGKILNYGLQNNKLALIDRTRIMFPVIDDIDLPGMGEIEGHYQPILKPQYKNQKIGQLKNALIHDAYDDPAQWLSRHERYAVWEKGMNARKAWPQDPRFVKKMFKILPFKGLIAFLHCYGLKLGFLDGRAGFDFAKTRWAYYRLIAESSKPNKARANIF